MKIENETYKILMVIAGGFIFAAGVNLFIVPLNLYSGGKSAERPYHFQAVQVEL